MSRATRRKHVQLEVLQDDFSMPTPNQQIVKIMSSRGNNLHEVQAEDNSTFLVSMPNKFRKNVWVRRGNFVLVEPIAEGDKVKAEIVRVLTAEHVKYFKQDGVWPSGFDDGKPQNESGGQDLSDEDGDLFVNTNRVQVVEEDSESSEEETDENSETESGKN